MEDSIQDVPKKVFGDISAKDRATELVNYCKRHLNSHGENNDCIEYSIMIVLQLRNEFITLFCKNR